MQDLNDKITGGTLTAAEWNEVPSEIQNVIEALGITLSPGDLNQLGKGVAGYVANGNFYTDSGAANAYALTQIGSKQTLTGYTNGAAFEFIAGNDNTGGAATVNVAGLGVKNITLPNGSNPTAGQITGRTSLKFDAGNDRCELQLMGDRDFLNTTRINVASAATVDLTSNAPDTRHINITGTTAISAFTVAAGQCYFVRFDGVLTLTDGASIVTQRGADIITAAGDTCVIRATAVDVIEVLFYSESATFIQDFSSNGFQKLPSGLIIQWGVKSVVSGSGVPGNNVTLPLAYANSLLQQYASPHDLNLAEADGIAVGAAKVDDATINLINSSVTTQDCSWMTIGH